jgi:hypothetical protein
MFFSEYFGFPVNVITPVLHSYLNYTWLLPDGQKRKVWEPSKWQYSFRGQGAVDRKVLSLFQPSNFLARWTDNHSFFFSFTLLVSHNFKKMCSPMLNILMHSGCKTLYIDTYDFTLFFGLFCGYWEIKFPL